MAYYTNKYGQLTSTYGLVGDTDQPEDRRNATEIEKERMRTKAQSDAAQMQAETARRNAILQAETQKHIAELTKPARAYTDYSPTFAKGGPVIKGEFKHANPTYAKFGKTGDSSLLAKGRK